MNLDKINNLRKETLEAKNNVRIQELKLILQNMLLAKRCTKEDIVKLIKRIDDKIRLRENQNI